MTSLQGQKNRSKPENFYVELELVFSWLVLQLAEVVDKASRMVCATTNDPGMDGGVGDH